MASWEHFPHVADIGVRGYGDDPGEAFEQAALALTAVVTDPAAVTPRRTVALHCEAPDIELLFVDWLNALVYEMATRRMLFAAFEVRIADTVLDALAGGEEIDIERHRPAVEVKGATLTALAVERIADGRWRAQCVVDV